MFSSKKKTTTPAASASNATATVDVKAVERLFDSLVDPDDPDTMYMDGISKMCESLGLDPATDVRVLVLLWKLGAVSKPGCITRNEFVSGFQKLRVGDVDKLKALVPSFDPGFLEKSEFRGALSFPCRTSIAKSSQPDLLLDLHVFCRFLQVRVPIFAGGHQQDHRYAYSYTMPDCLSCVSHHMTLTTNSCGCL